MRSGLPCDNFLYGVKGAPSARRAYRRCKRSRRVVRICWNVVAEDALPHGWTELTGAALRWGRLCGRAAHLRASRRGERRPHRAPEPVPRGERPQRPASGNSDRSASESPATRTMSTRDLSPAATVAVALPHPNPPGDDRSRSEPVKNACGVPMGRLLTEPARLLGLAGYRVGMMRTGRVRQRRARVAHQKHSGGWARGSWDSSSFRPLRASCS
jgi:hypothetical protein